MAEKKRTMSNLSTTPANVNLSVRQGDTFAQSVFVREKDGAGAVSAVNLTGWTAKMQVKTRREGTAKVTLQLGSGITASAIDGRLDIRIESTATTSLTCAEYVYDLQIINPADSNFQRTLLAGKFTVTPQTTT
jgi:hypothetical protein